MTLFIPCVTAFRSAAWSRTFVSSAFRAGSGRYRWPVDHSGSRSRQARRIVSVSRARET